ncbi:hypothetical protein GQ44DRAFT_34828 [Phaeosphaeriaceae sp. PMI808]|nr:hypothetical protein GQ44DRAFT_34828 [Phaeosphaeriaceae sp. PMI808]
MLINFSNVELFIGIICACLASFKPFLRRHCPRLLGTSNRSGAFTTKLSRTSNTAPNAPPSGYELESSKGFRKSSKPQKCREQPYTINESQEDIFRVARTNEEAIKSDARPSQKGSFLSDRSNVPPVSHGEF